MKSCLTYLLLLSGIFSTGFLAAQDGKVTGTVTDKEYGRPIPNVEVVLEPLALVVETNRKGVYAFTNLKEGTYKVVIHAAGFVPKSQVVTVEAGQPATADFTFDSVNYLLDAVVINDKQGEFGIDRLRSVEGTAIYSGKKNEVIRIEGLTANLATNNSRQVFARVAGLNIWESDGAGLQLGVGGRGLSPNRTSNFNTRQNGYDIAADALGYPESYYSPPTEALDRIEIVRGAASLQYGTQFGGMLNFVFNQGPEDKKIAVTTRQTAGSWGLFSSFNSVGGQVGKMNYYSFYQFKRGNGWRPNSGFQVHTGHAGLRFDLTSRLRLGIEYTGMQYLAQQAGGLTDALFNRDPRQSIRDRNWFRVNWNLAALTLDYDVNGRTKINIRNFGLLAGRESLGFLGLISRADPGEERDLISGKFMNFGSEARLIHKYDLLGNPSALLIGGRYYQGHAQNRQGLAGDGSGPDFEFLQGDSLNSDYVFPSRNVAVFAENMFSLTPEFSLTPGVRVEYIRTESDGYYVDRATDLAGNVIFEEWRDDTKRSERNLALAGLGASYKKDNKFEVYANFSQNYRAITFNDLRIVNPNFRIDENLTDERGFNADLGFRGRIGEWFQYDMSAFYLRYDNRIGVVLKTDSVLFNTYRYRTNVADSRNLGFESFFEADLLKLIQKDRAKASLTVFSNIALIDARYVNANEPAVDNKKVELVPFLNVKGGTNFRWKKFRASWQIAYVSEQFTDATNAEYTPNAVNGLIPAYYVTDLSLAYEWKFLQFEGGVNNLTNNLYFTRRAAAYPGPGIIPSDGRSFYLTLQAKF